MVQVANAESALNVTEKKFFHRVNSSVSRPKNVFIEFNRWDCTDDEGDEVMVARARQQHYDNARSFLVDDLSICEDAQAVDRVFFVSAKEALAHRVSGNALASPQAQARYKYDLIGWIQCVCG